MGTTGDGGRGTEEATAGCLLGYRAEDGIGELDLEALRNEKNPQLAYLLFWSGCSKSS